MTSTSLRLFTDPSSNHSQIVMFVLAHKGLSCQFINFDWMNKQKEVLDANPFARIPTLFDGDFSLYESRAICRYLCDKFPTAQGSHLFPHDVQTRARVEQWCSVEAFHFYPDVVKLLRERVWGPKFRGKIPDDKICAESVVELKKTLTVMDAQLSRSEFIVGNEMTLADVFFAPLFHHIVTIPEKKDLVDAFPHVSKWWNRVSQSKGWVRVMQQVEDDKPRAQKMLEMWQESQKTKTSETAV